MYHMFLDTCSTRSSPKPRTSRSAYPPEIRFFGRKNCSEEVSSYCLNGGTCFTTKLSEFVALRCELVIFYQKTFYPNYSCFKQLIFS